MLEVSRKFSQAIYFICKDLFWGGKGGQGAGLVRPALRRGWAPHLLEPQSLYYQIPGPSEFPWSHVRPHSGPDDLMQRPFQMQKKPWFLEKTLPLSRLEARRGPDAHRTRT